MRSARLFPNSAVVEAFEDFASKTARSHAQNSPRLDHASPAHTLEYSHTMSSAVAHTNVIPDISTLRRTTLREVCKGINQLTLGAVLFAKVCGPRAFRISPNVATNILIQDENGDYMMACIYNYVKPDQEPAAVFGTGACLALMQPYMKNAMDDPTQNLMLRCDNPLAIRVFRSEIEWLKCQGKLIPEALLSNCPPPSEVVKDLHSRGNESFRANRIDEAIHSYTEALSVAESANLPAQVSVPLLSNRAQCFIAQEQGHRALDDANRVLLHDPTNQKAIHRRVRALLLLPGRLAEAVDACAGCMVGRELQQFLTEVHAAIAESQGDFDEPALIREAKADPGHRVARRHADFFASDSILIAASGCAGGRGIVAKADLPADSILMATKSFCSTALSDSPSKGIDQVVVDPYEGAYNQGLDTALAPRAVDLLQRMPVAERAPFFSLCSGPVEAGAGDAAALNIRRIKAILKYNSFARTSVGASEISDACERIGLDTRLGRLATPEEWLEARGGSSSWVSGLWILPSLMNHSCCPNARVRVIGDFMFVHTVRPVAKGEEVLVSYVDACLPARERARRLADGWGFDCACERCRLSRSRPEIAAMEAELAEVLDACGRLKSQGSTFEAVLWPGRIKEILRAWSGIPESCQAMLVGVFEVQAGQELALGDPSAALRWSERQDALRRATGTQCDPHSAQRNQLFRAGCLLEMGRRDEARARMARARALCGAWLGSGADFLTMCSKYMCVADPRLLCVIEALAIEVDRAYRSGDSGRRRQAAAASTTTLAAAAAALVEARCCFLPSIPLAPAPISPAQAPSLAVPPPVLAAEAAARASAQACGGCGAAASASVPLFRCAACRGQWYCSRGCQRAHWPAHKGGCRGRAAGEGRGAAAEPQQLGR